MKKAATALLALGLAVLITACSGPLGENPHDAAAREIAMAIPDATKVKCYGQVDGLASHFQVSIWVDRNTFSDDELRAVLEIVLTYSKGSPLGKASYYLDVWVLRTSPDPASLVSVDLGPAYRALGFSEEGSYSSDDPEQFKYTRDLTLEILGG